MSVNAPTNTSVSTPSSNTANMPPNTAVKTPPNTPVSGFERALTAFTNRLSKSETAKFKCTTVDELKVTILSLQAEQRSNNKMMNLTRLSSFIEAMENFGKVIEVFLNVTNFLAFVWGPMKLLILTARTFSESFEALLDAYQSIVFNLPVLEGYQSTFANNERMQKVLEVIWANILEFHIRALRIFEQSALSLFFRSLWRDFDARFKHIINDLKIQKDMVEGHANQIHIQHYESDRLRINHEFEQAEQKRAAERQLFVVQWIQACRSMDDQEAMVKIREDQHALTSKNPGAWILRNQEIKNWLAPSVPKESMLWISGIPGAGKSVLASVVIEKIEEESLGPIAFFYCKHRDSERNTFVSVVKAILKQLLLQQRQLISFYYDEAVGSGETSLYSPKMCKRLARYLVQNIASAFLVLDGLDECEAPERKLILDFLHEMTALCDKQKPGKLRILIMSREEPDIKKSLMGSTRINITIGDTIQDIKNYVANRSVAIQTKFAPFLNNEDREYIEHNVLDRSDGMFLYAKLVMENLENQPSFYALQKSFNNLPQGLEEAYSRNLDRIRENSDENVRHESQRILSLMICCRRPLRWREIQGALSISLDELDIDASRRLAVSMDELCGSLVQFLPGDRIDFVHVTASACLESLDYISRVSAEQSMAILCLHYLSFDGFEENQPEDSITRLIKQGYFTFQDYALSHWADHFITGFDGKVPDPEIKGDHKQEASNAVILFSNRFRQDLHALSPTEGLISTGNLETDSLESIMSHARAYYRVQGDKRDDISLSSLANSVRENRLTLEGIASTHGTDRALCEFYGQQWFKCPKVRCFYFHEGFAAQPIQKAHADRHDRPFSCSEPSCLGADIGFPSRKELEKHKRNLHPGIDKMSSSFARFKQGPLQDTGKGQVFTCSNCRVRFKKRVDFRTHAVCCIPLQSIAEKVPRR